MKPVEVLVMGGTRFMGLATVERLVERGHRVTVFNRGTTAVAWRGDVKEVHGDRDDPAALSQLARASFDAVVDFSAYRGRQTIQLLDSVGHVDRFVHCSTGAVYQPSPALPWSEDTSLGPWRLWGDYAAEKLAGERALAARRETGTTTVLRLPYVLGPRNYAPREEFVLNRILDGEEILVPGDGEAVVQMVSRDQVAEAAVRAVEDAADGYRELNCACKWFVSLRGFVDVAAAVAGREARIRSVDEDGLVNGVFNPMDCVFPFPNASYVLDVSRLAALGLAPPEPRLETMLDDALRALIDSPQRRRWERTPAEAAAGVAA